MVQLKIPGTKRGPPDEPGPGRAGDGVAQAAEGIRSQPPSRARTLVSR